MYRIKYSQQAVATAIDRIAEKIEVKDNTVFLVLMNGGAWFAHELIRRFADRALRIEYARVSSYKGKQQEKIAISYMPDVEWKGKDVVILDDICDSGKTANSMYLWLQDKQPESVRLVTLLSRKGRYKLQSPLRLTSCIEDDSDDFFVGCGLDDNGYARNLPYIGVVE